MQIPSISKFLNKNAKEIARKIINQVNLINKYHQSRALFPYKKLKHIIEHNRLILKKVNNWVDDEVYRNSIFQYGMPEEVKAVINKDIGKDITYSDALLYLSNQLKKQINYLELGVSVGKNFFQVLNYLKNSNLVAFDIENINPVLESFMYDKLILHEWDTMNGSIRKEKSTLSSYNATNNNQVMYLSGDIWDEKSWLRLSGKKFNLIFSDAFHSPDALMYEYNMLKKYELLDSEEFIIMWDDLGGEMTKAFMEICNDLRSEFQLHKSACFILPLNGWIGVNWNQHNVGIILKVNQSN